MPDTTDFGKLEITLTVASEAELRAVAAMVARFAVVGDVILLDGPLAAGKTAFVKGFCAALAVTETVTSPTYVIANIYDSAAVKIVHVDAYRLRNAGDFYNLGLDEEMESAVTLVEWGSLIRAGFDTFLQIDIALDPSNEQARTLTISRSDPGSFEALFNELGRIRCNC